MRCGGGAMWKGLQWPPPTVSTPRLHQNSSIFQVNFLFFSLEKCFKSHYFHQRQKTMEGWWECFCLQSSCWKTFTNPLTYAFPGLLLSSSVLFSWSVQNGVVKVKLKATCYAAYFNCNTHRNTNVFTCIRASQASTDREWTNQQFPVFPVRL